VAFLRDQTLWGVVLVSLSGIAQDSSGSGSPIPSARPGAQTANTSSPHNLAPEQKLVLDTVRMAVDLPVPNPQDRLRVLASAADLVSTVDRKMAKDLWREGVRIESELVRAGQKPVVSMMSKGQADCAAAEAFVENLPPDAVIEAEQSLIGAVTSCPKQTLDTVARKLDAALEKNLVAPRALMAAIEAQGTKTPWSQSRFESAFKSLPDPKANTVEALDFAALYSRMAGEVDKARAEKAGIQLLSWLGKLDDTPERSRAISIATQAMQQALGQEGYRHALQSDVSANAAAQSAVNSRPSRPSLAPATSVLNAIRENGSDQSERLRNLPPSRRAREAAAHGFSAGARGDKGQADKYFDMAFAAADDVWETRNHDANAVAVVEEVGEAAAQVDSLNALERAQKLRDSSAQAIAMLAVARVVAGKGLATQTTPPPRRR
jgi:hypothetical protein